jgi:glycosyltransferase involved in cell wall biosynthesis
VPKPSEQPPTTLRVAVVGPPLENSGGIGRVMQYALRALPDDAKPIAVLDTRGPKASPVRSITSLARALWLLGGHIHSGRVNVVHINISSHGSTVRKLVVAEVASRLGAVVVLHLHASSYPEFVTGLPDLAQRLVKRGFGRAVRVIVLGDSWKRYVTAVLGVRPDRVVVLPNAVPGPLSLDPRRRAPDEALRICFLGRLGDRKGTPELLEALALLDESRIEWQATLAGDGDIDAYRRRAAELGLAPRIAFPGWVGSDASQAILRESHVLVLPSHAEGLPMSVLEAMAVGVPAVTTPVGALPEVIQPAVNGCLIDVGDIGALSGAVCRLAQDEPERYKLALGARSSWERNFTIERYAERLLAVWRMVAETKGH